MDDGTEESHTGVYSNHTVITFLTVVMQLFLCYKLSYKNGLAAHLALRYS